MNFLIFSRAIHDIVFGEEKFEQVYMRVMSNLSIYEFADLPYAEITGEDEDNYDD